MRWTLVILSAAALALAGCASKSVRSDEATGESSVDDAAEAQSSEVSASADATQGLLDMAVEPCSSSDQCAEGEHCKPTSNGEPECQTGCSINRGGCVDAAGCCDPQATCEQGSCYHPCDSHADCEHEDLGCPMGQDGKQCSICHIATFEAYGDTNSPCDFELPLSASFQLDFGLWHLDNEPVGYSEQDPCGAPAQMGEFVMIEGVRPASPDDPQVMQLHLCPELCAAYQAGGLLTATAQPPCE